MVSKTVRNPLRCRFCDTRLVVECERSVAGSESFETLSFACPACRGWNVNVSLRGQMIERVFLDPRAHKRYDVPNTVI